MPGCNKKIEQIVPTRYSYKSVPANCGQTGIDGFILRRVRTEVTETGEG
jgi:hypothetical protein